MKYYTNEMKHMCDTKLDLHLKTGEGGLCLKESRVLNDELSERTMLKEKSEALRKELKFSGVLKAEPDLVGSESKVEDYQALKSSLDRVRKAKCEIEEQLTNLKRNNTRKKVLLKEKDDLQDLKKEILKAKEGEVSRKIKLAVVSAEALIDPMGKMRKFELDAALETVSPDVKGDFVEVVLKGSEESVDKSEQILKDLTSTYEVLPLRSSQQSLVTACEGLLLKQIRRMTGAAIGFKEGSFYIFGPEKERSEAKAVIKNELKLCTSSSWRRWSFFRGSSVVGRSKFWD